MDLRAEGPIYIRTGEESNSGVPAIDLIFNPKLTAIPDSGH
jgi:hypothetical protein